MATGAWGTAAVERAPIKEIPLINEVHIDGLVRVQISEAMGFSLSPFTLAYGSCRGLPDGTHAYI